MSGFADNSITDLGSALVAGVLAGGGILFTRVVLGDGHMPAAQSPATMTDVVSPRATASITKCSQRDATTAVVGARFTNEDCPQSFTWRELGLYAKPVGADGTEGDEALFSYGYVEQGEEIPAGGGSTLIEKLIDVVTYVGDRAQVDAVFDPDFEADIEWITDEEIDLIWGTVGGGELPEEVYVPMTDPEVDALFGEGA